MICLSEVVTKYKDAQVDQLLTFEDKVYVRVAMGGLEVLHNGVVRFHSVCQEVHEDFDADLPLEMTTGISHLETVKSPVFKDIKIGDFCGVEIDVGRLVFVQTVGVYDFKWNGTDLEYHYVARVIQPKTQDEIQDILLDKHEKMISDKYVRTEDPKVVKLVFGDDRDDRNK